MITDNLNDLCSNLVHLVENELEDLTKIFKDKSVRISVGWGHQNAEITVILFPRGFSSELKKNFFFQIA